IGLVAGFVVVFGIEFIDKVLKVDDPVGAVGVHGLCGATGTLLVGLLSDGSGTQTAGLFCGGGISLFLTQLLGVVCVAAWVAVTMVIVFQIIKHTIGLRVTEQEEISGLDGPEHGLDSAYADFMPVLSAANGIQPKADVQPVPAPVEQAVPVQVTENMDAKITKITIICQQSRFEELKDALNSIGVKGITVTQVLGCGAQKGNTKLYRGVALDMILLPKLQVDVVVSKVPVSLVIDTAKRVLYTGSIGDGKIFVSNVENVVKVRTGEEGVAALQLTGDDDDHF
ncbi:MAG: P-II family nitrogen regulator, partial [Lachnospiraceae bacterium]